MKMFKRILLGAMSLLAVGGLASCGKDDKNETPEVPDHQHSIVTDSSVEAKCDSEGLTEGSHCSTCGEIIVKQNVIPALGHDGMVCSRCGHADITEEFITNMSNSIDWEKGVLLSIPDCDVKVTLSDGSIETSFIMIPEIYVNLSSSTELYGKFVAVSEDIGNDVSGRTTIKFKLIDDLLILNKEEFNLTMEGNALRDYDQNYVLSLSYLEKHINNLYTTLIELTGVIDYIQQFVTEYKDVVGNLDIEYSSDLINTIFDAKIDGNNYVISNNKKLLGEIFEEIAIYLKNTSIEDLVNDYVKGIIGDSLYNDYFRDGAFNTIFNSDTISVKYDEIQAILEGIKLEDIIKYVEVILEEKMGVESTAEEPYQAIKNAVYFVEYMVSQNITETNGEILKTVEGFVDNIPDMSLYELALNLTSDTISKDNILSVVDIINSIKNETIIDLILSSMGIEIEPIVFDAYLTILEAEINKYNKKFDFSVVTSKTGVIQSINMGIDNLQINDMLFKYSFELAFGDYTSEEVSYAFVEAVINDYNENMNKVSHSMFDVFAEFIPVQYTIDDVSEDGKTITLTNSYTEVTDQYTLAEAMIMDDFGTTCVSYSYLSDDDEAVISFVYNEEGTLIGAFIERATLLY